MSNERCKCRNEKKDEDNCQKEDTCQDKGTCHDGEEDCDKKDDDKKDCGCHCQGGGDKDQNDRTYSEVMRDIRVNEITQQNQNNFPSNFNKMRSEMEYIRENR